MALTSRPGPGASGLVFFGAIGPGFLLVEIALFSLLIFTGVGSALSARSADPRALLLRALAAAAARVAMAVLAPFGVALGMAMPLGLRRLDGMEPEAVPFAWGVNGVASVVASVLGVAVAIRLGFPAASLLACGCYGVAFWQALRAPWPKSS